MKEIENRNKAQKTLKSEHIEAIKQFVRWNKLKAIKRVTLIKAYLKKFYPEASGISLNTLESYMKKELRLSYKNLNKITRFICVQFKKIAIRKFIESGAIQRGLTIDNVKLIFLDEFSINNRHWNHQGWTFKGFKRFSHPS